jgi:hypothetical protein
MEGDEVRVHKWSYHMSRKKQPVPLDHGDADHAELEERLQAEIRGPPSDLVRWRSCMCVSRDSRGAKIVNPNYCVCLRIRAGDLLDEPPGASVFAGAMCGPRIVDEASERQALMYHSVDVSIEFLSERLQEWIAQSEKEAPRSSAHVQARLEIISEYKSLYSAWGGLRASRDDDDVTMLDFCGAQNGAVPSWAMIVCMLDAVAGGVEDRRSEVESAMCASIDALEAIIQDSAHRLGEIAFSSKDESDNEIIKSRLEISLHAESGWCFFVEREFLAPLSDQWRSSVRRAMRAACLLSGDAKGDGQQKWRTMCACFGWLSEVERILRDWFSWYSDQYAMVQAVSSIEIPPSLDPSWMNPFVWHTFDMSTRTMRQMMHRKRETAVIIRESLSRSGMRLSDSDSMRSHCLSSAAAYIFAEEY